MIDQSRLKDRKLSIPYVGITLEKGGNYVG